LAAIGGSQSKSRREKTMGTSTATIDSRQMLDCSSIGGEEEEMTAVLSRYWPSFYRQAFRYLGNLADAEDAVQDAL
jgi:hypothetical protein